MLVLGGGVYEIELWRFCSHHFLWGVRLKKEDPQDPMVEKAEQEKKRHVSSVEKPLKQESVAAKHYNSGRVNSSLTSVDVMELQGLVKMF